MLSGEEYNVRFTSFRRPGSAMIKERHPFLRKRGGPNCTARWLGAAVGAVRVIWGRATRWRVAVVHTGRGSLLQTCCDGERPAASKQNSHGGGPGRPWGCLQMPKSKPCSPTPAPGSAQTWRRGALSVVTGSFLGGLSGPSTAGS